MGVITIRRIEDDVIERLKEKAKLNGRSMEEEARIAIANSVSQTLRGEAAAAYFTRRQKELFGDRVLPDSTPLIREMREADPTAWDGE